MNILKSIFTMLIYIITEMRSRTLGYIYLDISYHNFFIIKLLYSNQNNILAIEIDIQEYIYVQVAIIIEPIRIFIIMLAFVASPDG